MSLVALTFDLCILLVLEGLKLRVNIGNNWPMLVNIGKHWQMLVNMGNYWPTLAKIGKHC
jgi:hypothetical protein